MGTWIVGGIIAVFIIAAVAVMLRSRKKKPTCSDCSGCSGCPARQSKV